LVLLVLIFIGRVGYEKWFKTKPDSASVDDPFKMYGGYSIQKTDTTAVTTAITNPPLPQSLARSKENNASSDTFSSVLPSIPPKGTVLIKDEKKSSLADRSNKQRESSSNIKLGQRYAGGIVFYIDATGKHGLVCTIKNIGEDVDWYEANKLCNAYNNEGYSDWYLPSSDEIQFFKNINEQLKSTFYWSSSESSDFQGVDALYWAGCKRRKIR